MGWKMGMIMYMIKKQTKPWTKNIFRKRKDKDNVKLGEDVNSPSPTTWRGSNHSSWKQHKPKSQEITEELPVMAN